MLFITPEKNHNMKQTDNFSKTTSFDNSDNFVLAAVAAKKVGKAAVKNIKGSGIISGLISKAIDQKQPTQEVKPKVIKKDNTNVILVIVGLLLATISIYVATKQK